MSHGVHAYILNDDDSLTESWAFESLIGLFKNSKGVEHSIDSNPFTKKSILKLTIDQSYVVSASFGNDSQVSEDLESILDEKHEGICRIRILFGSDPDNDFDDIVVMIYEFLESLDNVVVYSANQEKVLYRSS